MSRSPLPILICDSEGRSEQTMRLGSIQREISSYRQGLPDLARARSQRHYYTPEQTLSQAQMSRQQHPEIAHWAIGRGFRAM